ncbi:hypothetical protein CRUP_021945 [Coryphaenoides rupestris]|nr:hypothetical protein CRUP_021945 [Coryphaenoides rupestris]
MFVCRVQVESEQIIIIIMISRSSGVVVGGSRRRRGYVRVSWQARTGSRAVSAPAEAATRPGGWGVTTGEEGRGEAKQRWSRSSSGVVVGGSRRRRGYVRVSWQARTGSRAVSAPAEAATRSFAKSTVKSTSTPLTKVS